MTHLLKHAAALLSALAGLGAASPSAALTPADEASLKADCIHPLVWGGFETRDDIYEAATTWLGEPSLSAEDKAWIKSEIARQWDGKKQLEASWPAKTDTDRLDRVFKNLDKSGILALQNAGNTQSESIEEAGEEWQRRGAARSGLDGYIFFQSQDLARVVENGELYLGFGVFEGSKASSIDIARRAGDALVKAGFKVTVPPDDRTRLHLTGIDWKKHSPP